MNNDATLAIIENNDETKKFLSLVLSEHYKLVVFDTYSQANEYFKVNTVDLIIFDYNIFSITLSYILSSIRNNEKVKNTPIIVISSQATVNDIIRALDSGADDFIAKPFDYNELLARIRVRLREKSSWLKEPRTLHGANIKLIVDTREVFYFNKRIDLTTTEFDILKILMENAPSIITRDYLIKTIWKTEKDSTKRRTIDVHIRSLRKKIPSLERNLTSVYGKGYRFET
jgi:DNA-binding response OmpR family regulator